MAKLSAAGYERVHLVEARGQCALRGGILDVYPVGGPNALRVEFFDDEIDSIRSFDVMTQRSISRRNAVRLYPAQEFLPNAEDRQRAIAPYVETARAARDLGLGLNAGHDLSLENLAYYVQTIPWTDEVSIGHALICDALYLGLETTIHEYLSRLVL